MTARAVGLVPPKGGALGTTLHALLGDLGYRVADPQEEGCVAALVAGRDGLADCADLSSALPVLVLDASTDDFGFRLEAARSGASAVLSDPPDPGALASWLDEVDRGAHRPARVLIVDDDPFVAEHCAVTLQMAGFETRTECDPDRVLGAIAEMRPDLLLLDMQMPGASGVEVASVICQDRASTALPIVFLSGERDPERRMGARRVGGDDFIAKGVDSATLIEIVTMRTARARALGEMAARDGLTGLPGHAAFHDALAGAARRSGDGPASVGMIDLDRFKSINDAHGHPAGDEMLRALARTLRGGLRGANAVARYGGEEFAVIIDAGPREAARVIDRLRARFAGQPATLREVAIRSTFSAGVASLPAGPPETAPERGRRALTAADGALYRAKRGGRNRVVIADDGTDDPEEIRSCST